MSVIQQALNNLRERIHDTNQGKSAHWYLNKLIDDLEELKAVEESNITDAYNAGVVDGQLKLTQN